MRLALRLGRTLEELGRTMSAAEFALWLELYREEPWDDSRDDLRAGIIAATVANYAGKVRKEGVQPATPLDFMPFVADAGDAEPDEIETDEEPDPLQHFSQYK